MLNAVAALGAGERFSSNSLARLTSHLASCHDCQLLLATRLLTWEQNHELPPPPQAIARWRSVALHLSSPEEEGEDDRESLPWGWQHDRDQDRWWWRFELQVLEELALAAWVIDGDHLRRWIETVSNQARSVGGFEETSGTVDAPRSYAATTRSGRQRTT